MGTNIAFIGAGKVSEALGLYFKSKGFEVCGYFSRNPDSAKKTAKLTNSRPYASLKNAVVDSQMIWITTPDDQIQAVAKQISELNVSQKSDKLILHASGVHSRALLHLAKEAGYNTACAHPLLAFGDPIVAQKRLNSAWFAIEEPNDEKPVVADFLATCGNHVFEIDTDRKALYHAAACFLSNYAVTLLHVSHKIFEKSGIAKDDVSKAVMPLLESVIDNLKNKHCDEALTGPIKRGDNNTIEMHLNSLQTYLPQTTELYRLLRQETEQMLSDCSPKKH